MANQELVITDASFVYALNAYAQPDQHAGLNFAQTPPISPAESSGGQAPMYHCPSGMTHDSFPAGRSPLGNHPSKLVSYTYHLAPSTHIPHHHKHQHQSAGEKNGYFNHETAMPPTIRSQNEGKVSKWRSPKRDNSRDLTNTPPKVTGFALAATHPSNYAQQSLKAMAPPPFPPTPRYTPEQTLPSQRATPDRAAPEPQWRTYTDPMWQTSSDPHYWSTNCTILKSDRCLEPGNVISPTWMIGLPCGGMVEMAHHYPSEERLQREKNGDQRIM